MKALRYGASIPAPPPSPAAPGEDGAPLPSALGLRERVRRRAQGLALILVALLSAGVLFSVALHASDITLFQNYASAALKAPLLRSLPKEYPALSIVIFILPKLLVMPYAVGFALVAAIAGLALVLSSDGLPACPGWSLRACAYLFIGVLAVVFARYDIFPALTAFLAVEGARQRRWGRAWAWAVVGGMLKLFPFLLLPGFFMAERAQTGKWPARRAVAACVPVAVLTAAQSFVSPGSLLSPIRFEWDRGFELSSLQGSLTLLTDPLHARWVNGFGSVEVVGIGHSLISGLVTAGLVAALAAIFVLAWRRRLSVEAVSLAVLSVAVLGDKAFAAQYLIWLIPLWAYWPLRKGWVAAAALTTAVYPFFYAEAHAFGPSFYLPTATAAVRNCVLLVATVCWLRGQLKLRSSLPSWVAEPVPPGSSDDGATAGPARGRRELVPG